MWGARRELVLAVAALLVLLAFVSPAHAAKPDPVDPPVAEPVIVSLSAYSAPPLSQITIYGTGFGSSRGDVTFAGENASIRSWSDTEIVATVPQDAVAGYVGVIVDGVTSNGIYFVPGTPPVIDSVSTQVALPGQSVTIYGAGFGSNQGDGTVTIADMPAVVQRWRDTQITITVPQGARAGYLGVIARGISSNGVIFRPFNLPVATALSVSYARVGSQVTITGTDFGGYLDTVTVGGVPVVPDSWTDTSATFTVPSNVTLGYVGIVRDGYSSNGLFLVVAPRVDATSSWWAEPGGTVTITGEGFGDGSDGYPCLNLQPIPVVSWSDTRIIAQIPTGATSGYVGVVRGGGRAVSNGRYLTVVALPRITSVNISRLIPGQTFDITGTGFGAWQGTSQVRIGTQVFQVVGWSDTKITVRTPEGAVAGYIGVYKSGLSSNGVWLQPANATPVVTAISNWWGVPGTTITITGSGFGATQGYGYPVFAGTRAEVVSWSDTQVVAIVPEGAATGYVGINRDGFTSNGKYFMPYLPPSITSLSVSSALVGDTVTVIGEGFRDAPGKLTIGGVEVQALTWTENAIEFVVPAGISSGYVGVTHDGRTSNGKWLTIQP